MNDFVYWLGDVFYAMFSVLEKLGDMPNNAFLLLGFVGLFIWLNMQKKFNAEAKQNPNQLK